MGWPEIVVNSAARSGDLARLGLSIFSSHCCSRGEGFRLSFSFSTKWEKAGFGLPLPRVTSSMVGQLLARCRNLLPLLTKYLQPHRVMLSQARGGSKSAKKALCFGLAAGTLSDLPLPKAGDPS